MATFYFSGIEKAATSQALISCNVAGMMSQLLYTPALLQSCGDIPLTLDSGAYSKVLTRQDMEKYAHLIILLQDRCVWYASPDVIGDQERSNKNYSFLLSLLPEHLHSRILWIYQSSSDLKYLHEGLEQHVRVGIGGLVPLLKANNIPAASRVVCQLARIVANYHKYPHFFGLSIPGIIAELHTILPDFSVDSTTWLIGGKYGLIINNQGQQKPANMGGYNFSTSNLLEQNIRTMDKWTSQYVQTKKPKHKNYIQHSLLSVGVA